MKEVLCGRGRALVLPATAAWETQHVHGGMSLPVSAAWLAVQLVLTLHPIFTQTHTQTYVRTYVNTQFLRLRIYADSVDWMTDTIWFLVFKGRSGNVCFLSSRLILFTVIMTRVGRQGFPLQPVISSLAFLKITFQKVFDIRCYSI